MPKQHTPAKHKTPNYCQVKHTRIDAWIKVEWWTWEPMPLRADRKDLP